MIDEDGRKIEINDVIRELLFKYFCVDWFNRKLKGCKSVDIYWFVLMLKVIKSLFIMVKVE